MQDLEDNLFLVYRIVSKTFNKLLSSFWECVTKYYFLFKLNIILVLMRERLKKVLTFTTSKYNTIQVNIDYLYKIYKTSA